MIFDRTLQDTKAAKQIRDTKIKNSLPLTVEDLQQLERGLCTLNTLNRIESKQLEIKALINSLGYWNTPFDTVYIWEKNDFFGEPDFARWIKNLTALKNAFFVYEDTPTNFEINYNFENLNAIEKFLADLENMVDDVQSNTKECGDFYAGE